MRLKFTLLLSVLLVFCFTGVFAQVTSSSMAGIVRDDSNKVLSGAIIEAIHVPTGSKYGTDSKSDGSYNIQNMNVGGPYKVTVSFGGAIIRTYENLFLQLGEVYQLDIKMGSDKHVLDQVTVVSSRDNIFNNRRTGASTTISNLEISTLPTTGRSIGDFTRLTPQSSGSNFGGRNSLYNNVQLNGANFNNSFGLSSGLPGGGQPFPLDAVDQIQVGIADFDIKQSNFTGANINIVTRRGTNDFTGSAYTYYRDQSFNGMHVNSTDLPAATSLVNQVYGIRVGGPIIKDKLFFFVNAEYENSISPGGTAWKATGNGVTGAYISRANSDSLKKLSDFVKNTYHYDPGAIDGYNNSFNNKYTRIVGRLDYNINDKHKLNASFMQYNSSLPSMVNSTSAANGSLSTGRNGANSLAFGNTIYNTDHQVSAFSVELASKLNNNINNQLLASYTHVRDTRSSPSSLFPFVDIESGSANPGDNYTSLGYELFSYKNDVQYNTLAVYDNITINKGRNFITGGASFQYLTFKNSFLPYGTSYYRYNTMQDFMNNAAPIGFGYTYPYAGQDGYAKVHYGLPGVYGQDKIQLRSNLVVTIGLRIDMPLYLDNITKNAFIDTLKLLNDKGDTVHYDVSKWPEVKAIIQPRISFNWSPLKDKSLQVRGGTGIYMGQIPFVWLTNVPGNNGTVTNNVQINNPTVLQNMQFQVDPAKAIAQLTSAQQSQYFPTQAGNSVPGQIAAVDPKFKMPEVWRSSLGADYKLPWLGLVGTLDLMYTKDIYSVNQFNANLPKPTGHLSYSGDTRDLYPSGRIYSAISGVYVLKNTNLGDAYSATIGISKPAKKGFYGSLYYTAMYSEEVSQNPGSQASSAWFFVEHVNSPNDVRLSPSSFFAPHRIVGTISYRFEYLNHLATTVSAYYNGESGGRFSFLSYADINRDGVYNDLIYIPKDANELTWTAIKDRTTGATLFTAQQQADAFNAFIKQDKYLSAHKGQYAERNGAKLPMYHTLNMKIMQDIYTKIGKRNGSLQISADILNIPNMFNSSWGVRQGLAVSSGQIISGASTSKGVTTWQMATITNSQGQVVLPTSTFLPVLSSASTWGMQLGLRFTF